MINKSIINYKLPIEKIIERNFSYSLGVEKSVNDMLNKWLINKEFIYNLFGEKEIVSSEKMNISDPFEKLENYDSFLENIEQFSYLPNFYVFCDFLIKNVGKEGFFNNKVIFPYSKKINEEDIKLFNSKISHFIKTDSNHEKYIFIPKGIKLTKAIKFFFKDDKIIKKIQDFCSTFLQKNYSRSNGYIKLSIHPYDFLTISNNEKNWDTCHEIEFGDYRVGNFNYLADSVTLVAYYITEDDHYDYNNIPGFQDIIEWNSKVWRMLIHIQKTNKGVSIIYNDEYPFHSKKFFNESRELLHHFLNKKYNILDTDFSPLKTTYQNRKIGNNGKSYGYPDITSKKVHYETTEDEITPIEVGEDILCFSCGNHKITTSHYGVCCDCFEENCLIFCEECGASFLSDSEDLYPTRDGRLICGDCAEKLSLTLCDSCLTYVSKEEIVEHNNNYYCSKCEEELNFVHNNRD